MCWAAGDGGTGAWLHGASPEKKLEYWDSFEMILTVVSQEQSKKCPSELAAPPFDLCHELT